MTGQAGELTYYIGENGRIPFRDWLDSLIDVQVRGTIIARLARLRAGNFGHCAFVGHSVFELKIDYGPGYRVYFGRIGIKIILLLCGGDKSTQQKDILAAHRYWQHFKEKCKE